MHMHVHTLMHMQTRTVYLCNGTVSAANTENMCEFITLNPYFIFYHTLCITYLKPYILKPYAGQVVSVLHTL